MTTIGEWLKAHDNQTAADQSSATLDLQLLVCHILAKNTAWLFAHQDFKLNSPQVAQLNQWSKALKVGKPLAYIVGYKEFWDLTLRVNKHTLVPRPETELLIETICELLTKPKSIIDLGTGSGAIALALAKQFPTANITATDQSNEALKIAKINAELNSINSVKFILSNWLERIDEKQFDLIVSNPPYIDANDQHLLDLTFEPIRALVADDSGLADFKIISKQAKNYLKPGGIIMFEHGWNQRKWVAEILLKNGFVDICHKQDLSRNDRITWGYQP